MNADIKVDGIEELEKKLGKMKNKVPVVLYRALNRAVAKAKTESKREVYGRYFISQSNILKTIKVTKASRTRLSAKLTSRGGAIALSKFKVSPRKRVSGGNGKPKPSVYKAGVKKDGGVKPLSGNPKAFFAIMKSGHEGIMARFSVHRLPLKQLYGPAVPSMIKNEEILEQIKKDTAETLQKRIDAEVNNILQRGR